MCLLSPNRRIIEHFLSIATKNRGKFACTLSTDMWFSRVKISIMYQNESRCKTCYYKALHRLHNVIKQNLERVTRLEPATLSLGSWCSTNWATTALIVLVLLDERFVTRPSVCLSRCQSPRRCGWCERTWWWPRRRSTSCRIPRCRCGRVEDKRILRHCRVAPRWRRCS